MTNILVFISSKSVKGIMAIWISEFSPWYFGNCIRTSYPCSSYERASPVLARMNRVTKMFCLTIKDRFNKLYTVTEIKLSSTLKCHFGCLSKPLIRVLLNESSWLTLRASPAPYHQPYMNSPLVIIVWCCAQLSTNVLIAMGRWNAWSFDVFVNHTSECQHTYSECII